MDNEKIKEFNSRMPLTSARFYNSEIANMDVLDKGYRIAKPMSGVPYLSLDKKTSNLKAEDFMLCIGTAPVGSGNSISKIFEQDVIDYSFSDSRGAGVVLYDPESYSWAVKDLASKKVYSFKYIKINKILGNLYTCENLIGCDLSEAYKKLGKKVSLDQEDSQIAIPFTCEGAGVSPLSSAPSQAPASAKTSAVDVFVKVDIMPDKSAAWSYKLKLGSKVKEDSQMFKKSGENSGYYFAAAGIIALSKLNTARDINFFTPNEALYKILQNDQISIWEKNEWRKPSGEIVKNSGMLKELNGHITRLGGHITAQMCKPDFGLAI